MFSSYLENTKDVFGEIHFQFLWLFYVASSIVFLASLFGYSVIIHIIRTDNAMKTTTNYLILNQACADILITIAELMNAVHYSSLKGLWFGGILGQITCKFTLGVLFSLPVFSLWILATISIDRFYAITRPLRSSPVSRHLKKTILLLWALSLLTNLNNLKNGGNIKTFNQSHYCALADVLQEWSPLDITVILLDVPLPLIIIAVMYTIVCLNSGHEKDQSWGTQGKGSSHAEQQSEAVKIAKKITLMMIAVVVLYVICWFPLVMLGIFQYTGHVKEFKGSFFLFIIGLTVVFSAINPYVYLTFSQNFRNGFKSLFRDFPGIMTFCNTSILRFEFKTQSSGKCKQEVM